MIKALSWFGFILLNVVLLVLFLGYFTPHEFKGTATAEIDLPRDRLFAVLSDFENIPGRRTHIRKVEKMAPNEKGLPVWKEFMSTGGFAIFEIVEVRKPEFLHIAMKDSSFEMKGDWKYTLKAKGEKTELTLEEASKVEAVPVRVAYWLSSQHSKDSKVQAVLDNLKKTVENH